MVDIEQVSKGGPSSRITPDVVASIANRPPGYSGPGVPVPLRASLRWVSAGGRNRKRLPRLTLGSAPYRSSQNRCSMTGFRRWVPRQSSRFL